jgi:hypothetical protein
MTISTAVDGATAAGRLVAEQQDIMENLIDLEDHLGRKLLDTVVPEGVSRGRRVFMLDGFATLWTPYERYRTVAVRVRARFALGDIAGSAAVLEAVPETSRYAVTARLCAILVGPADTPSASPRLPTSSPPPSSSRPWNSTTSAARSPSPKCSKPCCVGNAPADRGLTGQPFRSRPLCSDTTSTSAACGTG